MKLLPCNFKIYDKLKTDLNKLLTLRGNDQFIMVRFAVDYVKCFSQVKYLSLVTSITKTKIKPENKFGSCKMIFIFVFTTQYFNIYSKIIFLIAKSKRIKEIFEN